MAFVPRGRKRKKLKSEAFTNSLLLCTCGFSAAALNLLCAARGCKEFIAESFLIRQSVKW